jgi:cobalt/nickel transport system ATP-binding protein
MVECNNIIFSQNDKLILDFLSFKINEGEKVVLLGVNGSGKSTLLKLLNGLLFAQSGEYKFDNNLIDKSFLKMKKNFTYFRKECSLLFQNIDAMLFCESVKKELLFSPELLNIKYSEELFEHIIHILDLKNKLDSLPFMLSGGEKQKVALACVLLMQPSLLLLDEPTSSLDNQTSKNLVDYIRTLKCTTVISTHSLTLAEELGDRAIVLKDGKIIYDGKTTDFTQNHNLLHEAGFLHIHDSKKLGAWHSHK